MTKGSAFFKTIFVFILVAVLQVVGGIVASVFQLFQLGDISVDSVMSILLGEGMTYTIALGNTIYGIVALIIFGIWYSRLNRDYPDDAYPKRVSVMLVVSIIMMAAGLQYVVNLIVSLIQAMNPAVVENYDELMETAGFGEMTILLAIYSIIIAPIIEEIAFRGIILKYMKNAFPVWFAIIWQAFLFGVMHANLVQGTYAFAIGLVLGFVCLKGGGIKYSIPLHLFFNIFGTIGAFALEWTLDMSFIIAEVVGCVIAIIGIILFVKADEA